MKNAAEFSWSYVQLRTAVCYEIACTCHIFSNRPKTTIRFPRHPFVARSYTRLYYALQQQQAVRLRHNSRESATAYSDGVIIHVDLGSSSIFCFSLMKISTSTLVSFGSLSVTLFVALFACLFTSYRSQFNSNLEQLVRTGI